MAVLTNYEGSNDDLENSGTSGYNAQGFKVPSNSTCTSISLYGSRGNGATGTFALEVYSGTSPSDTLVKTQTFNTSILTAYDGSPHWDEVTFSSSFYLAVGTQYYIIVRPLTGSTVDENRWSADTTSPSYPDGSQWAYTGSWAAQTGRDKNFRINGTIGTNYPLTAALGTFTLTGIGVGFPRLINMVSALGSFTLTGIATNFGLGKGIVAGVGSFILTGIDALFRTSQWIEKTKNTSEWTEKTKNDSSWTEKTRN